MKCLMNGLEVNYPCSPVCALFGDCVVAFNKQKKANVRTNGDRLRAMSDEELATVLYGFVDLDSKINYCKNKPECGDLLDTEDGIPTEMCINCLCEWLRRPAEEE